MTGWSFGAERIAMNEKKRRHTNQVQKFSSSQVWLDLSMPRAEERE